ncbi:undecaprenyl/decaprenyl-phosphate alpha-N-acetylglucosaminyl 1-phosphate transferase [Streptomyces sp. NPDC004783]|uniref:undecaprenyl/decaprenyl-phosphate alpha-N-acetylglucosaminyl 1-phosphate transferase n=1 Tax=Streptomyces sp. NPDC004783 TaxID=3154459 RepID=UPI0033BBCB3A
MLYGITASIASFLLAALLSGLLRAPALRLALVVDRRRARPVPAVGGVAVILVTGSAAGLGHWSGAVPLGTGVGRLLAAGCAVGALGLAADVWRLRRRWLLAGTAVAAAWAMPYDGTGHLAGALAAVWVALVATAFRGLDHADGVAGTVGTVTAVGVGVCAAAELMEGLAFLLCALAAALAGFLLHNWHPARIALGASGALFTGFLLAGAAVFTRTGHAPGAGAGVLFALTALVSVDAVLVLLARGPAGRPRPRGGSGHLAHRLRGLGVTPQGVVVLLGAAACAGVLVGVLVHLGRVGGTAVLVVAVASAAGVLGLLRARGREPRTRGHESPSAGCASRVAARDTPRGTDGMPPVGGAARPRRVGHGLWGVPFRMGRTVWGVALRVGRKGRRVPPGMGRKVGRVPLRIGRKVRWVSPRIGQGARRVPPRMGQEMRGRRPESPRTGVESWRTAPGSSRTDPGAPRTGYRASWTDGESPRGLEGPGAGREPGRTGAGRQAPRRARPGGPEAGVAGVRGVPVSRPEAGVRTPSRGAVFPVRRAARPEEMQVSAPLRVRNG